MPRLPQPGADNGTWGDILNEYLSQSLKPDGTLQDNVVTANTVAPNSITNSALASNAVNAAIIEDGSITETLLDAALKSKINTSADVSSVAGKTGIVTLDKSDVGLNNVDNTSDTDKPVSTATLSALSGKVDKVTTPARIYGVNGAGADTVFSYGSPAAASSFVRRDSDGRAQFAEPAVAADAASKGYVDTAVTGMVTLAGTQTLTNKTLSNVRINGIFDTTNGTRAMAFGAPVNAVNYLYGYGNTTGASPQLAVFGDDTNINLQLSPKGTGTISIYAATGITPTIEAVGADTNHNLSIRAKGTGTIRLASDTSLQTGKAASIYNTSDETTNYERARHYWSSGVYTIGTEFGGTGGVRNMELKANGVVFRIRPGGSTAGLWEFASGLTSANNVGVNVSGSYTASSGVNPVMAIQPTINQTGTAGYTGLLINTTETSTGSGAKNLIDAQVGSVSKFRVNNAGQSEQGDYALTSAVMHLKGGSTGMPILQMSRGSGTTASNTFDFALAGGGFSIRDVGAGYVVAANMFATSNSSEVYVGQKGSQGNLSSNTGTLSASTHSALAAANTGGPNLIIQGGGGSGTGTPGDIQFKTFSTTTAGQNPQSSTVRATIKATTGEMTIANPGTGTGSVVSVDGTQTLTNKNLASNTNTYGAQPLSAAGGMIYINHGAINSTARPSVSGMVAWIGSVEPLNAIDGDVWIEAA